MRFLVVLSLGILFNLAVLVNGEEVRDVVIVGGGLSGLTAGYRLSEMGMGVEVYEARARLGGRAHTHEYADGSIVELGGEWIEVDGSQRAIIDLAGELGVELGLEGAPYMMVIQNGQVLESGELAEMLSRAREVFDAVRDEDHNDLTMGAFIDRYFDEDVGDVMLAYFKDFMENSLDEPANEVYLDELEGVFMFAWAEHVESYQWLVDPLMFGPVRKLLQWSAGTNMLFKYRVKGGNRKLVDALAGRIGGDHIHLEHELTGVERLDDGTYELIFDAAGAEKMVRAKRVVMAVPLTIFQENDEMLGESLGLPDVVEDVIEDAEYYTYGKLIIPLKRALWREKGFAGMVGLDADLGGMIWDGGRPSEKPILTVFFRGSGLRNEFEAEDFTDEALDRLVERYIAMGFERDESREVIKRVWTLDQYAMGSYSMDDLGYETGSYRGVVKGFARPYNEGTFFFAGEHVMLVPGYLNSAVASGDFVAEEIERLR